MRNFNEVLVDKTRYATKISTSQYERSGKYPIIDQGKENIAGYRNTADGIYADVPAIIFGDHTRVLKVVDEPFFIGADGVKVLRQEEPERYLYKYLYYYLKHQNIPDTGYNRHFKWLKEVKFPCVALDEQEQVVAILDRISSLLESYKQEKYMLDTLVKSRFVEMFGDPVENDKAWKCVKLSEISNKITSGNTPKGGSNVYVKEGIPFLRSQNVWNNRIDISDIAYIDEETHEKMKETQVIAGDILITKTGRFNTENSSLGRSALYTEEKVANVNGHVYLVRLKEGYLPEFILAILTSDSFRTLIRRVCVGGIDKRQLNKSHIEDFPIILPPLEKQRDYVKILEHINKLKFAAMVYNGINKIILSRVLSVHRIE